LTYFVFQLEYNSLSSIGSPRHSRCCSLGRPPPLPPPILTSNGGDFQPLVVIESAFTRLHVQTSHTTRVKNYDGSDVTTTTTRHKDGVETVSEVMSWPDTGRLVVHELVRNLSSGKTSKQTDCFNEHSGFHSLQRTANLFMKTGVHSTLWMPKSASNSSVI